MTLLNKAFGKKLHLSFPGRTVNRDAFDKDVSPGIAVGSSVGLVRFSCHSTFGLTEQCR